LEERFGGTPLVGPDSSAEARHLQQLPKKDSTGIPRPQLTSSTGNLSKVRTPSGKMPLEPASSSIETRTMSDSKPLLYRNPSSPLSSLRDSGIARLSPEEIKARRERLELWKSAGGRSQADLLEEARKVRKEKLQEQQQLTESKPESTSTIGTGHYSKMTQKEIFEEIRAKQSEYERNKQTPQPQPPSQQLQQEPPPTLPRSAQRVARQDLTGSQTPTLQDSGKGGAGLQKPMRIPSGGLDFVPPQQGRERLAESERRRQRGLGTRDFGKKQDGSSQFR